MKSNSEFLEVNGVIGIKTMASSDAASIVYDSNPVFSRIYLYKSLNSLQPELVRVAQSINNRVS